MNLSIGAVDLAIVLAYLVGVVLFGVWIGRGRDDVAEYLLGGRDIPWWAILGSIVATETSTATFLSVPGLAYAMKSTPAATGDLRFLQLAFGYVLGRVLVVVLLLPHYFRGDLYTAYEVLNRRFGGATKRTASLIFLVTRNLADGLRLYLTAIVLEQMTGLSLPLSVAVAGGATILYTVFGGIRSVVWNDCVQFVIYIAGALFAGAVILSRLPGGWEQFVSFGESHEKFRLFDLSPDGSLPYTIWAGILGGAFLSLGSHGTDQMMVQRYLCARSRRDAARAILASGVVVFAQFLLFLGLGVGLAAFYDEYPPTVPFAKPDHVFPTFIIEQLPVGILGLTLAAVFSAAMSTLSSSLNSSATAAVNDLLVPLSRREWSSQELVRLSRALTVTFGLVQIGIGIAGRSFAESVVNDVLAIAGFATGLLLGLFFLGVLTRRVTQTAALVGLVGGLVILCGVKFGHPLVVRYGSSWPSPLTTALDAVTTLAWPWYTVVGSTATFLIGLAASLVWTDRRPHRDIDLSTP